MSAKSVTRKLTIRRKGYRVVRDFAGVRNNRASSPYERFADANRAAMHACVVLQKPIRVFGPDDQFIVEYAPVNGQAQASRTGE